MVKGATIDFRLDGQKKRLFVPLSVIFMYGHVSYHDSAREFLKAHYPGCKTRLESTGGGIHRHDLTEITELERK